MSVFPVGSIVYGRSSGIRGEVLDVDNGRPPRRRVKFDDGRDVWVRVARLSALAK